LLSRLGLASLLSAEIWLLAALNGYALEMLWLPAAVIGASWREPQHSLVARASDEPTDLAVRHRFKWL
jgi:hypothetical protein